MLFCFACWGAIAQPKGGKITEDRAFKLKFFDGIKEKSIGNFDLAEEAFLKATDLDKTADAAWYELAKTRAAQGKLGPSIAAISEAIALVDTNVFYLELAANLYRSAEDVKKALELYDQIIALRPQDPEAYLGKASLYEELGEVRKTDKLYEKVIEITGETLDISYRKIQGYVRAGKIDKAIEETELLIKEYPSVIELREMQADFLLAKNDVTKAVAQLQKILEVDPNYGKASIKLAMIYVNQGKFGDAITAAQPAFKDADVNIDEKMRLMLIFYESSNLDKTHVERYIQLAKDMTIAHPTDGKSHAVLGDILLRENKLDAALESYLLAIRIAPDKRIIWERILELETTLGFGDSLLVHAKRSVTLFPSQPVFYLYKGLAEVQNEAYEDAIFTLETGIALIVSNPGMRVQFLSLLGDAANASEKFKDSDRYYEQALDIDPQNALVLNNYSYSLAQRNKRLEEAKSMIERALKTSQPNASYLDTYAWVLYQLKDYEKARLYIQRAMDNGGSNSGTILEHYGDILYALEDVEEAVSYWERARDAGGGSDKLLEKIEKRKIVK